MGKEYPEAIGLFFASKGVQCSRSVHGEYREHRRLVHTQRPKHCVCACVYVCLRVCAGACMY